MTLHKSPVKKARRKDGIPVVTLAPPTIRIRSVQINGQPHSHFLFRDSDTHVLRDRSGSAIAEKKNLQGWSRGRKIEEPEWTANRNPNLPACVTRTHPVAMRVRLTADSPRAFQGKLHVTPSLNKGNKDFLKPNQVLFSYPANAKELWVPIDTGGQMPDWVGRYVLTLEWKIEETDGTRLRWSGPKKSQLTIFCVAGNPLDPDHDSERIDEPGKKESSDIGTRTGTKTRLDRLMELIGRAWKPIDAADGKESRFRHPVSSPEELEKLFWRLHRGINDTPGAPPYFDAAHGASLELEQGGGFKLQYPLEDQWLAWAPTADRWNDLACIGHVQLLKTMLASVGIFSHRAWVVPSTTRRPDGGSWTLSESDLYFLSNLPDKRSDRRKKPGIFWNRFEIPQIPGVQFEGFVGLAEPDGSSEAFEACTFTPGKRFLPGGYETKDIVSHPKAKDFVETMGFRSARELLRWYCVTERRGPPSFRRFLVWGTTLLDPQFCKAIGYEDPQDKNYGRCFWDRDGKFYTVRNFVEIREKGMDLPPP